MNQIFNFNVGMPTNKGRIFKASIFEKSTEKRRIFKGRIFKATQGCLDFSCIENKNGASHRNLRVALKLRALKMQFLP